MDIAIQYLLLFYSGASNALISMLIRSLSVHLSDTGINKVQCVGLAKVCSLLSARVAFSITKGTYKEEPNAGSPSVTSHNLA